MVLFLLSTHFANDDEDGRAVTPRTRGAGEFRFHCDYLQLNPIGKAFGRTCTWMAMFTHTYTPLCMLWKGSDLMIAAGKKALRSISLGRTLAME